MVARRRPLPHAAFTGSPTEPLGLEHGIVSPTAAHWDAELVSTSSTGTTPDKPQILMERRGVSGLSDTTRLHRVQLGPRPAASADAIPHVSEIVRSGQVRPAINLCSKYLTTGSRVDVGLERR